MKIVYGLRCQASRRGSAKQFCRAPLALSVLMALVVGAAIAAAEEGARLYVATNGSDAWSGKLPAPNEAKTDGPFATLAHAVAAARRARATVGPGAVLRIVVRRGAYYLRRPITLGPQDSGLIIEGGSNEVVVSGGRVITGWRPYRGNIRQADLSDVDLPDLSFRELYCNGKRQPIARTPNFDPEHPRHGGFLYCAGAVEAGSRTKLRYRPGELDPTKWTHPERAIVVWWPRMYYENVWAGLKTVDAEKHVLEVTRGYSEVKAGERYYVCNLLEELDAPGEWYCDPASKTLYFWPPSDNIDALRVTVPALDSLFVIKGDTEAGPSVERVRIQRLALRDCRKNAVDVTGVRNCTVAACDIRNVGVAVRLGDETHACRVVGCDITQTLQDGIAIWGTPSKHGRVSRHVIDNNYIWDFGYGDYHNRVGGVWLVACSNCKVTHNHIHDGPRYAIGMDVGNDNEIAYNYCHHVNLETADTGIIEAATAWHWGLPQDKELEANLKYNRGNSIHHNLLHDSGGYGPARGGGMEYPHYSWGIYLDTHCSNWRVHDNVVYNTVLGGFMLNCGLDNVVENNVFADGQKCQIQWNPWRNYEIRGNRCERNIIHYRGKSARLYTLSSFEDGFVAFKSNLIYSADGRVRIAGVRGLPRSRAWDAWVKRGQDQGSLLADPLFVDPAKRDYRLRPESPAFKLGFKPIDLSRVGNYASADRRTWPRPEEKVHREPASYDPAAVKKPTQPLLRTYEDYAAGEKERDAHVGEEGNRGTARVTDETAASGKHSLKFTDAADLKHSYVPYVTYPLEQEDGALTAGFDLRWEKGAQLVYEWRDDPYYYSLGPCLAVDAEGGLRANGRLVMTLPPGQWVRLDMTCTLGPQSTGKYELTVRVPGAESKTFSDLAHAPDFKALNCVVVMSVTKGPSVFYLDNVGFRPARSRNIQRPK